MRFRFPRSRRATRYSLSVLTVVSLVAALAVIGATRLSPAHAASSGNGSGDGRYQHVFVIMMENTGFDTLLGNPNAPWINEAIQKYGVAGQYYGVTHPSQPNYIAATSGALNGVNSDNDATANVANVVDQLEAKGVTWKAYMQSLNDCVTGLAAPSTDPSQTATYGYKMDHSCGVAPYGPQLYQRKHNPFVSYQDVYTNPSRMANVVDLSQLATDLAHNTVPNYAWISPNQCNDMHGVYAPGTSCDYSQEPSIISAGDAFLSQTVGAIMASQAWRGNSAIFITWDESDFTNAPSNFGFGDTRGCCDANPGGGHVLTLVITHHPGAESSFAPYNHYSLLATVEDNWHLGCLANTCDTAHVQPMADMLK